MTIEKLAELIDVKEAELEGLRLLEKELGKGVGVEPGKKKDTKPAKTEKAEKKGAKPAKMDYESMKSAELYQECCRRKISSQCKERNKDYLVRLLKANDEGKSLEDVAEKKADAVADEWGEEPETENPYIGKKASDLYKECKNRGISVEPRQEAGVYAALLLEDDKKADSDGSDGFDDEDWNID